MMRLMLAVLVSFLILFAVAGGSNGVNAVTPVDADSSETDFRWVSSEGAFGKGPLHGRVRLENKRLLWEEHDHGQITRTFTTEIVRCGNVQAMEDESLAGDKGGFEATCVEHNAEGEMSQVFVQQNNSDKELILAWDTDGDVVFATIYGVTDQFVFPA